MVQITSYFLALFSLATMVFVAASSLDAITAATSDVMILAQQLDSLPTQGADVGQIAEFQKDFAQVITDVGTAATTAGMPTALSDTDGTAIMNSAKILASNMIAALEGMEAKKQAFNAADIPGLGLQILALDSANRIFSNNMAKIVPAALKDVWTEVSQMVENRISSTIETFDM